MITSDSEYGFLDSSIVTNLSFAIFPYDDFTNTRPIGHVEVVSIRDNGAGSSNLREEKGGYKGIQNSSGFYLFLDIAYDKHLIVIKSDRYFEVNKTIDLSQLRSQDPSFVKNPVIPITLLPNPSYPFSTYTTLIRGTVKTLGTSNTDAVQTPVSSAKVRIDKKVGETSNEREVSCATNEKGDYVLYFKDLSDRDILPRTENGVKKKFINFEGGFDFKLIIEHPDYKNYETISFTEGLEEGRIKAMETILLELKE